jgi:hypothetical protein
MGKAWICSAALVLGGALAPPAMADEAGWGLRQDNPVAVCEPAGQRAWLQQLRCADGSELSWQRSGSVGPRVELPTDLPMAELDKIMSGEPLADGEVDYHVIDAYQVDCGGKARTLYLDMYHCELPAPQRAPAGFLFVAAEPASSDS